MFLLVEITVKQKFKDKNGNSKVETAHFTTWTLQRVKTTLSCVFTGVFMLVHFGRIDPA